MFGKTYVSEFALTPPSPYVAASSIYVCAKGDTITDVEISAKAGVIPGIIKQGFPKFILVLIFERIWAAIRIQYLGCGCNGAVDVWSWLPHGLHLVHVRKDIGNRCSYVIPSSLSGHDNFFNSVLCITVNAQKNAGTFNPLQEKR